METTTQSFSELIDRALTDPGIVSAAYSAFYGYSLGNQLLAMWQCDARKISAGPIATFVGWKSKGRFVRKGEKAIALCMPVTCKRKAAESAAEPADDAVFTRFVYRSNWFVLSQTDGADFAPEPIAEWDSARALATLQIERIDFDLTDGNVQGFARKRSIAVSPIAALPYKTMFHEIAHVILGHTAESDTLSDDEMTPRSLREVEAELTAFLCCQALGLPGADESRGYVQHWNAHRGAEPLPEKSAQKVMKAADQILRSGRPAVVKVED